MGLSPRTKKPIVVEDVSKDNRFREQKLARAEDLVSMLSVPMSVKSKLTGVINIYTTERYKFTKPDILLLTTIADQAAVAIGNTELLISAQIARAELEARKTIERAKGILMKEQGLNEEEAFRLMRKSSMDKRVSMKNIAEAIMLSHEIRKPLK